ncbi:MAG TPA: hypothetical protein VMF59_02350, partial [Bacteroidota bacterium]|nr:hypothetical protein [Bacteroidota bacterium]
METPGFPRPPHSFRIAFALPAFLIACWRPVYSQGDCVAITRAREETISTLPGKVLTTALTVTSLSSLDRRFESRLELPPGWRNLAPDFPFVLSGNRSDVRLLSIAVPPATPPGKYRIRYSLSDNAVPPCRAGMMIEVSVEAFHRIQLQILEAPHFVVSGSPSRVSFVLRNLGNGPSAVRLSVRGAENISAVPDSASETLHALESRPVSVLVTADPSITEHTRYVLELRAAPGEDTAEVATASCLIEVLPRGSTADLQFHEVPLDVTVRAAGESGRSGGQTEVAGGGTITDRGTERVDL